MHTLTYSTVARATFLFSVSILAGLSGCSSGGDSATVNGDVPIAYVMRPVGSLGNPTDSITFTPGGDLYIRNVSSASAPDINVTGSETKGQGDVSDPEVSYDATKLLFSMRRATDPGWRIWEYDIANKSLRPIVCTVASGSTPAGDDVDPAYLPDGRIVFVSNRQVKSQQVNGFAYLDEYERERVTVLHVMNNDGTDCHQISFNQSHDRNPTVIKNGTEAGKIMYSRWDHVGGRNQFTIFKSNPDGTDLFVHYGAHSNVVSFLHPRELPNGQLLSDAMPLSRTHEGGAIMQIDVANFSERCEPGTSAVSGCNGQHQPTAKQITVGGGLSQYGRFSTPYPLWDGSNRALVSWTPSCSALGNCASVTNPLTNIAEQVEGTPVYSIVMLNLTNGDQRPIVTPPAGYSALDPVAIQPRDPPKIIADKTLLPGSTEQTLANKISQIGTTGVGILNVKSVYDTDSQNRMSNSVLISALGENIPMLSNGLPDIGRLKNPALTTADQRPVRFVRITKAVPTRSGISRVLIGETDFEMQQILGYAEVEPDGSFIVEVPADVPVAITALDKDGRGFATHTNWIQARPGETRFCNGCHSPRRGTSINSSPIAGNHINTLFASLVAPGETMAATRTRLDSSVLLLKPDIEYSDVWSDTSVSGVTAGSPISIKYTGNANPADDLTTPAPATSGPNRGIIDYPTHIQPLWSKARPGGSCDSCHADPAALDLRFSSGGGGNGRQPSYDELLIGDPVICTNPSQSNPPCTIGLPIIEIVEDEFRIQRMEAQVQNGSARSSHLIEVLFGQNLNSDLNNGPTNHSNMLNAAEKRLVTEWIDLGAQYFNSSANALSAVAAGLRLGDFATASTTDRDVHTILLDRCGSCHRAVGQVGGSFAGNRQARFVLTGQAEGDFNVTLSMIGNVSDPANTELLSRPASTGISPAPAHPTIGGLAVMPSSDADYQCITRWITGSSCP